MGERKKKQEFELFKQFCEPLALKKEKIIHCNFTREFDAFEPSLLMSSLGPTQPDSSDPVLILSVPDSANDAVFVTPPENHFRSSSESETLIKRSFRVSSPYEAQFKKLRLSEEETQQNTEIVVLDDSDSENQTVKLGDDTVEITPKDSSFKRNGVESVGGASADCVNGGLGSQKIAVETRNVCVVGAGSSCTGFDEFDKFVYNYKLGDDTVEERSKDTTFKRNGKDKVSVDCVNGGIGSKNVIVETSNVSVIEKLVGAGTSCTGDDANKGQGSRKLAESVQGGEDNVVVEKEIDFFDMLKFAYDASVDDVNKNQERGNLTEPVQGGENTVVVENEIELPKSVQGGEENVVDEKEVDFHDMLEMMKLADEDGDGDEVEVDFMETARQRGVVFPRPRWWHPDWP